MPFLFFCDWGSLNYPGHCEGKLRSRQSVASTAQQYWNQTSQSAGCSNCRSDPPRSGVRRLQ